jgi:hypothetical protein
LPHFLKKGENTLKKSSDLNKNHSIRISIPENPDVEDFTFHGGARGVYIWIVKGNGIYNIFFSTLLGGSN